jgi:hypothetical protein
MVLKEVEGNREVINVLSWYFPGGIEKKHENTLGIDTFLAEL